MKILIPKLKAMMRYFASHTDPQFLGKTKLMKLFYFTDFDHVKKYAFPITFDNYVHLEHGPIPSTILNLINSVENDPDGSILGDTLSIETKDDSNMKRIVVQNKFTDDDKKYFFEHELEIMKMVCDKFNHSTGKNIEDASHKEAAWIKTKESENIPYTLAMEDTDCLVDKEDIEIALEMSK